MVSHQLCHPFLGWQSSLPGNLTVLFLPYGFIVCFNKLFQFLNVEFFFLGRDIIEVCHKFDSIIFGNDVGWGPEGGVADIRYTTKKASNDEPCLVMHYNTMPYPDFDR